MSVYAVESGIPLAPRPWRNRKPKAPKFPVATMQKGDSFFVPEKDFPPSGYNCLRGYVYVPARRADIVVTVRRTADGGMRVWRTA